MDQVTRNPFIRAYRGYASGAQLQQSYETLYRRLDRIRGASFWRRLKFLLTGNIYHL